MIKAGLIIAFGTICFLCGISFSFVDDKDSS